MWNQLPDERLRSWQDFRNRISKKSLPEALQETQHLWSFAPYVAHYLTTDNIKEWPGPWELIYENYFCDLAKALAILYTLYLTDHCPELEIKIYQDPTTKETYNLVLVEKGKYVLNYVHDEVVNKTQINQALKHIKTISVVELGLDKLL